MSNCNLFYGALLPPYWLVLASFISLWVQSIFFNLFRLRCEWGRYVFRPSRLFLNIHAMIQFSYFVFVACTLQSHSRWDRYQELGVRVLNSGFTTLLATLLFMELYYYEQEDEQNTQILDPSSPSFSSFSSSSSSSSSASSSTYSPLVTVTPPSFRRLSTSSAQKLRSYGRPEASIIGFLIFGHFLTHCLVGLIIYVWVLVIFVLPWLGIFYMGKLITQSKAQKNLAKEQADYQACVDEGEREEKTSEKTTPNPLYYRWVVLWLRIFVSLLGVFMFQISYNYMLSLYNSQGYLESIKIDLLARDEICYFQLWRTNYRSFISFLSFVI